MFSYIGEMAAFVPTSSVHAAPPPLHIQNKFKFYHISWKIEHFFAQTCEENWEICSPEFDGPRGARLKLILKTSRSQDVGDFTLSLTVRRSESDSGPEALWVNYRAFLSDPIAAEQIQTDKLCSLNKGSEDEVNLECTSRIFDETKNLTIKIDSLRIDCKIILYFEGEAFGLESSDDAIMQLTDDMLLLFESSPEFDVEFQIGDSLLQLHKSILCTRSRWFNAIIQNEIQEIGPEILTIDLSDNIAETHYEGMRKVVTFLYTGNLRHVLERPCLTIFDLAHALCVDEIKTCYDPENLQFVSTVDAQEFEFSFCIEDFNSACEKVRLLTPTFADVCSSRTWLFHFYPRSDEETGFVSIYAETNEDVQSMNVCLEISAVNGEGRSLSVTKMLRRHVDGSSMFGIDEFEYKNFIRFYAVGDILIINVKIKLSTGNQSSYIRKHRIPAINVIPAIIGFNNLSLEMKAMLEEGDFHDVGFITSDGSAYAHSCILAARCPVLYDMVRSRNWEHVHLPDMNTESLLIVLTFLYCGYIYDMHESEAEYVLAAAENFNIPFLRDSCLECIASDSTVESDDSI